MDGNGIGGRVTENWSLQELVDGAGVDQDRVQYRTFVKKAMDIRIA
jgi:hypothetical protein